MKWICIVIDWDFGKDQGYCKVKDSGFGKGPGSRIAKYHKCEFNISAHWKAQKKESTELHELNFKNLFAFVVIIVSYFCLQRHFGQVLIGI